MQKEELLGSCIRLMVMPGPFDCHIVPHFLVISSFFAADCSGQVLSDFDVEELTSDDIQAARCSPVGALDSAMGDCSSGVALILSWQFVLSMLLCVFLC